MNLLLEEPIVETYENKTIDMTDMVEGEVRLFTVKGPQDMEFVVRLTATRQGIRSDLIPKNTSCQHQLVALKGTRMNIVEADIYSLNISK